MRSNRLSQSPERSRRRAARSTGPPDHTRRPGQRATIASGVDALHDHQLLAARRAGDDPHVAPGDPELLGQEADQRRVGGALDGRRHDPDLEHAVDDVLDAFDRGTRREADGKADVGEAQDLRRRATGRRPRSWRVWGSSRVRVYQPNRESPARRVSGPCVVVVAGPWSWPAVRRTARDRPGRSSRPPRWRPRSRRSCPSTAPDRAPASVTGSRSASSRRPREGAAGPRPGRSSSRPTVISPRTSRCGSASELGQRRVDGVGREAGLGRVEVDVDLEQDRVAPPGPRPRRRAGRAARPRSTESTDCDRVEDLERPARLVRLERADELPARARRPRAPWPRPPGPGSRRGGRARPRPRRAAPRRGPSSRPRRASPTPGSRPARAQAAAIRARTRARAAR